MALTKAEMSEYLFDKLGLSKRDAKELVELFFEEIRRALENGEGRSAAFFLFTVEESP